MEKTTVFYAYPNGKIDIRNLTRYTKKPSTKSSVNQDGFIGISNDLSEDGPCPISKAKDLGSEKVVRETRKEKRFPVNNIEIVGEISFADKAEIINISTNGVLVNVPKRMDIGKKYTLKICSKEKKIVVRASVVWSSLKEGRRISTNQIIPIYTAGIEFQDISNENKKILKELIGRIEALTDHRKCERIPFVEDILLDNINWVRSVDISEEGLYLSSLQLLEKNSVVEVTIPSGQEKLTVKANVQFCDKMGFGLRFIDLNDNQRTKIKELIKSITLKERPDYRRE